MTATELPLTGGCQCGAVRYRIDAAPEALFVCHCTECRAQSASAFGISVYVRREVFHVTGETARWTRPATLSGVTHCHFCRRCGSRVWHEGAAEEATISVKGGSLDCPPDLSAALHIWTASKLPGVVIPEGATTFPGEPD